MAAGRRVGYGTRKTHTCSFKLQKNYSFKAMWAKPIIGVFLRVYSNHFLVILFQVVCRF